MLTPDPAVEAGPLVDPVTALEARIKLLNKQLQLKRFELDTVLSVAQGVSAEAYAEGDLHRLLVLTLQGQPHIGRVLIFVPDEAGVFRAAVQVPRGREGEANVDYQLPDDVLDMSDPTAVPIAALGFGSGWWDGYELLIPVLRLQLPVAFVFVGGLLPDVPRAEITQFLRSLALTLAGAIDTRRLTEQRIAAAAVRREIEIAQDVQRLLFPQRLPNDADLVVASSYVPHSEMGGDYYDVVAIDADRLLLCVADVSGKGVPASLLMSNFQAGLRTLLRTDADLATVVHELNHLLFQSSGGEKFITVFLGLYDRRSRLMQFVNAGHNNGLLLPPTGPALLLRDGTVMLGIMPNLPKLEVGEVEIPPRSLLFLYTDGLTEVFDAEHNEFGEGGILDFLDHYQHQGRNEPLANLHTALLEEIQKFGANKSRFADDVTVLSCWFK